MWKGRRVFIMFSKCRRTFDEQAELGGDTGLLTSKRAKTRARKAPQGNWRSATSLVFFSFGFLRVIPFGVYVKPAPPNIFLTHETSKWTYILQHKNTWPAVIDSKKKTRHVLFKCYIVFLSIAGRSKNLPFLNSMWFLFFYPPHILPTRDGIVLTWSSLDFDD